MADLLKVSILGDIPVGEVWSVNPIFSLNSSPEVSWDQLNTIATAINAVTVPAGLLVQMSTTTTVKGVKLEARNTNGTLQAQLEQLRGTPVTGTGSAVHPPQVSTVLSLRTVKPGPSGRGRLYWPANGMVIGSADGRMTTANAGATATAMKTYLSGISTAINTTLGTNTLGVWSRKTLGIYGVNRILCGTVLDTQRRRRDTAVETYSSVVYP